jgi:hypothetical protein
MSRLSEHFVEWITGGPGTVLEHAKAYCQGRSSNWSRGFCPRKASGSSVNAPQKESSRACGEGAS